MMDEKKDEVRCECAQERKREDCRKEGSQCWEEKDKCIKMSGILSLV